MLSQEDNLVMLTEFLEKGDSLILVIYVSQQGQLTPINDFPNTSKNKVSLIILLMQASQWNKSIRVVLWLNIKGYLILWSYQM